MLLKIMADESGKKASEQEKQLETADSILFAMKNLTQKDVEGKIHAEEYNVKLQDLYDKLKKVSGNDKINIYATELFNNVQKFLKGEIVNREALLEKHREVLKERGEVEKAENAKGQSEETVKKTELDQQKKEQQKKQEKEIEEKKKELHKPEGKPLDTPDNAPAKIITTTSQPEPVQEGGKPEESGKGRKIDQPEKKDATIEKEAKPKKEKSEKQQGWVSRTWNSIWNIPGNVANTLSSRDPNKSTNLGKNFLRGLTWTPLVSPVLRTAQLGLSFMSDLMPWHRKRKFSTTSESWKKLWGTKD